MPTLSGRGGGCAVADTCGAETGLVLVVASVTGESKVSTGEQVALVSAQAVLDYVAVFGCIVKSFIN